jgi:hypothetical protein
MRHIAGSVGEHSVPFNVTSKDGAAKKPSGWQTPSRRCFVYRRLREPTVTQKWADDVSKYLGY